ncbi:hypothetical protein DBV15_07105 [Temnothorax longispinosus]|uniref:Uncharacterized protein n=1 Tax=Temnothorax longispinosus TaxID=300112 RepID=A0A4V3SBE5_9HYME|nr:hypothetical protein DBV15_07105 [Temnothorax longispinosus]
MCANLAEHCQDARCGDTMSNFIAPSPMICHRDGTGIARGDKQLVSTRALKLIRQPNISGAMSRKRDAVSRAVARVSQRSNDVARPENIDHTGTSLGTSPDGCKSARRDEKRLIYGRVSKPVKKVRSPGREMVHRKDGDNTDDDDDDDNEDIAAPGGGLAGCRSRALKESAREDETRLETNYRASPVASSSMGKRGLTLSELRDSRRFIVNDTESSNQGNCGSEINVRAARVHAYVNAPRLLVCGSTCVLPPRHPRRRSPHVSPVCAFNATLCARLRPKSSSPWVLRTLHSSLFEIRSGNFAEVGVEYEIKVRAHTRGTCCGGIAKEQVRRGGLSSTSLMTFSIDSNINQSLIVPRGKSTGFPSVRDLAEGIKSNDNFFSPSGRNECGDLGTSNAGRKGGWVSCERIHAVVFCILSLAACGLKQHPPTHRNSHYVKECTRERENEEKNEGHGTSKSKKKRGSERERENGERRVSQSVDERRKNGPSLPRPTRRGLPKPRESSGLKAETPAGYGARFFRQLSQPFSADYAEALNNADVLLDGPERTARRGTGLPLLRGGYKERGGGGRGWGVAGRAGDFARRVIVKLSSIYFTNLHITSAVVAASQRRIQKRGWTGGGGGATRRVSSATEQGKVAWEGGGEARGWLCVLLPSRKGLQETTDFVAPATSDVRRPHEVVNTDAKLTITGGESHANFDAIFRQRALHYRALASSRPLRPPAPPLTGTILQEKIYGHANYPLKLRETNPRPSANLPRRPRARGVPPSSRTFKIRPIKLFEKLRLASNFPPRRITGFRDQIFNLRSFARITSLHVRRSGRSSAGARMTFLKRPLAYACVYACLYLASLFASFWSGNDYVTRVRGRGSAPRSGVTGKRRGRGILREQRGKWQRRADDAGARIRGTQPKGRRGGRWAKRRDGLRGCITCLLPDHKPPTKTLMSNVNGDNASDPFSIRDLFTQDRLSENIQRGIQPAKEALKASRNITRASPNGFMKNGKYLSGEREKLVCRRHNFEQNVLVYLKILARLRRPGRDGSDETLPIFAPFPPPITPLRKPRATLPGYQRYHLRHHGCSDRRRGSGRTRRIKRVERERARKGEEIKRADGVKAGCVWLRRVPHKKMNGKPTIFPRDSNSRLLPLVAGTRSPPKARRRFANLSQKRSSEYFIVSVTMARKRRFD